MKSNSSSLRLRMIDGFHAVKCAMTLTYFLRTIISGIAFVGACILSMRITGLEPFVENFMKTHEMLIMKNIFVNIFIFTLFSIFGNILFAFCKGLFSLPDEPSSILN